jgi:hypothetical protein
MFIARKLLPALRALRTAFTPAAAPGCRDDAFACMFCCRRFVCPLDWGAVDDDHWWVQSRCGECGVWSEVLLTNAQAARLDRELDGQQELIRRAAARLEAERMEAQADAFIGALQRDLIDASDFG